MSSDAVLPTTDEKTRGQLNAYQRLIEDLSKKVPALHEKSTLNDGARKACSDLDLRLAKESENIILRGQKDGTPQDEIKLIVEGVVLARKAVTSVGQDFLQESLMLKGEARALNEQAQNLRRIHEAAEGEARRKAEMGAEMEKERARRRKKKSVAPRKASTAKKQPKKGKAKGK